MRSFLLYFRHLFIILLYAWFVHVYNYVPQVGGCKAGTFDSYPKHSDDPFFIPKSKPHNDSTLGKGSVFLPSPGPKQMPTSSIMQQNVTRCVIYKNVHCIYCRSGKFFIVDVHSNSKLMKIKSGA